MSMASGMRQQQQTVLTQTTKYVAPVAATAPPAAAMTPLAETAARLAAHQIEPELLGKRPRVTEWKTAAGYWVSWVTSALWLAGLFGTLGRAWITQSANMSALAFVVTSLFVVSILLARQKLRKQRDLLRYGVAVPAVVQNKVRELPDTGVPGGLRLTFDYLDLSGERQCRMITASTVTRVPEMGVTFTVLIHPDAPSEPVPYFSLTDYRAVEIEATDVSREVSHRVVAVQIAETKARASAGSLGAIEAELLGAAPRRVRYRETHRRQCATAIGALAFLATLAAVFGALLRTLPFDPAACAWAALLLTPALLVWAGFDVFVLAERRRMRRLLRSGVATRALVTASVTLGDMTSPKGLVSFVFRYERPDGSLGNDRVTVTRGRAWQLGLADNATFTVLCDPKPPYAVMPYFQMGDAEIVGAMGARVTGASGSVP